MKMIRTTVSLPEDIYELIRYKSYAERKSMSEVLVDTLRVVNKTAVKKKIARSGEPIDLVKALREDRDRDNIPDFFTLGGTLKSNKPFDIKAMTKTAQRYVAGRYKRTLKYAS